MNMVTTNNKILYLHSRIHHLHHLLCLRPCHPSPGGAPNHNDHHNGHHHDHDNHHNNDEQSSLGCRLPIIQGGTFSFLVPTLAILRWIIFDIIIIPINIIIIAIITILINIVILKLCSALQSSSPPLLKIKIPLSLPDFQCPVQFQDEKWVSRILWHPTLTLFSRAGVSGICHLVFRLHTYIIHEYFCFPIKAPFGKVGNITSSSDSTPWNIEAELAARSEIWQVGDYICLSSEFKNAGQVRMCEIQSNHWSCLSLSLSFCWSDHVSSYLWSNVSKVISLQGHSVVL